MLDGGRESSPLFQGLGGFSGGWSPTRQISPLPTQGNINLAAFSGMGTAGGGLQQPASNYGALGATLNAGKMNVNAMVGREGRKLSSRMDDDLPDAAVSGAMGGRESSPLQGLGFSGAMGGIGVSGGIGGLSAPSGIQFANVVGLEGAGGGGGGGATLSNTFNAGAGGALALQQQLLNQQLMSQDLGKPGLGGLQNSGVSAGMLQQTGMVCILADLVA